MSERSVKACKCMRELNHLNSMQLMLMECLADKRWDSAETYLGIVKEHVEDVAKCAKTDPAQALKHLENTAKYIGEKEKGIWPVLRTLEDAYWTTIHGVCTK